MGGGGGGEEIWGQNMFFREWDQHQGWRRGNIILLHQFGKILKRYFPHLNSGKLSNCTVEEHYCISEVSRK